MDSEGPRRFGPVLVGMPGVGKTTVAARLAQRLAMLAVDCDAELARRVGSSIEELFARRGEQPFRGLERRVLLDLLQDGSTVIATGGGAVLDATVRARLRERHTVWLRASPQTLAARVRASESRPILPDGERLEQDLAALLSRRQGLYAEVSALVIDTDASDPKVVADWIAQQWKAPHCRVER